MRKQELHTDNNGDNSVRVQYMEQDSGCSEIKESKEEALMSIQ